MRNETMMLPVKCREGGSGDASFGHTLGTVGGFLEDAKALAADLRRRLPERCLKSHVTPSQLVLVGDAAEESSGEISSGEDGSGEDGSGDESSGETA